MCVINKYFYIIGIFLINSNLPSTFSIFLMHNLFVLFLNYIFLQQALKRFFLKRSNQKGKFSTMLSVLFISTKFNFLLSEIFLEFCILLITYLK